ncbi:MAG TPA: hypothetical protein VGM50_02790 [Gemmatimonadaceae bacterium]
MHVLGALYLVLGGAVGTMTAGDTTHARVLATDTITIVASQIPLDTIRRRPKAVEVSEWYSRRLTIHRWVAYATIPVFAAQWAAGEQLYDKSREAPTWAKTTHRVGATLLAGMFTVNTVTGAWNWWDSRGVEQGRTIRTIHAITMLGADAAFTYAGAKLSDEAENSASKRSEHRTIALSAMGVTVASELMMKFWNR